MLRHVNLKMRKSLFTPDDDNWLLLQGSSDWCHNYSTLMFRQILGEGLNKELTKVAKRQKSHLIFQTSKHSTLVSKSTKCLWDGMASKASLHVP